MNNLNKEQAIFILHSLIDYKKKDLGFYESMPLQDKKKNLLLQEIYNLQYVLDFLESF